MNFKPNKHELYLFNREKEREKREQIEKKEREEISWKDRRERRESENLNSFLYICVTNVKYKEIRREQEEKEKSDF